MKRVVAFIGMAVLLIFTAAVPLVAAEQPTNYKYQETKDLVELVRNAAGLVESKGEAAFAEFKKDNSVWRHGETYIFVVDADGNMVVHPDPALEGKNQMDMKDVNDKEIIKDIIKEAIGSTNKGEGWFHYQWPEPGTIFSSWKSAFVKRVVAASGKMYVVASGVYNIKMEDEFIVNMVNEAASLVEKDGRSAFDKLRDKSSQYIILGTYVFVDTPEGIEMVNGGFPDVEGKNLLDYKDPNGKYLTREVIDMALKNGSGWVDYMWPKPGETASSKKHTYVKKAVHGDETFAVAAGAYVDTGEPVSAEKKESDIGKLMVLELKRGGLASGVIVRETIDSIYLQHPDGSMEVSFPRAIIVQMRKPTDKELAQIRGDLSDKEKKEPAKETAK